MANGLYDLMVFGLVMVSIGMAVLFGMVHLELGPAARLVGYERWLLAAGLGSGILAFAVKLLIVLVLVSFPQYLIPPVSLPASSLGAGGGGGPVTASRYTWTSLSPQPEPITGAGPQSPVTYTWQALPERAPAPADNPTTAEKVALGKRLFFDTSLSRDGSLSCASCHDVQGLAGADGRPTAKGVDGQTGPRNSPSVWNAAFQSVLFWDGRAASLEQQVSGPLLNPVEMDMPSLDAVVQRVAERDDYRRAFAEVFGAEQGIRFRHVAQAIAAYERSLITPDTPYDRFVRGDPHALSPAQIRGMGLFQSLGCIQCHYGPNFSAASLLDNGMPLRIFPVHPTPYEQDYDLLSDKGAGKGRNGRGVWRVPSLRNVALTGPWLHNGSVSELREVVRIMATVQLGYTGRHLLWSEQERRLREINRPVLDDRIIDDLVAFLNALSSDTLVASHRPPGKSNF